MISAHWLHCWKIWAYLSPSQNKSVLKKLHYRLWILLSWSETLWKSLYFEILKHATNILSVCKFCKINYVSIAFSKCFAHFKSTHTFACCLYNNSVRKVSIIIAILHGTFLRLKVCDSVWKIRFESDFHNCSLYTTPPPWKLLISEWMSFQSIHIVQQFTLLVSFVLF